MWRFTVLDQTFREADMTVDQAVRLEALLGVTWNEIHPLRSAKQALEIAALMYADRNDIPVDDARKQLGATRLAQFTDDFVVSEPEDDLPVEYEDGIPLAVEKPSTPG